MGKMIVVETSSLPLEKQIKVKAEEISAIEVLIQKREEWLNKPQSKMRGTFPAVLEDTIKMRRTLATYREELKELRSILLPPMGVTVRALCKRGNGKTSLHNIRRIENKDIAQGWQWSHAEFKTLFTLEVLSWKYLQNTFTRKQQ